MRCFVIAASLTVFAVCGRARAENAPAPVAAGPTTSAPGVASQRQLQTRQWYGAPILIADALALTALGIGASDPESTFALIPIGIGAFLLVGPIVHAVHRDKRGVGLSIVARLVLPLAGAAIGGASCDDESNCSPGIFIGAVATGFIAASAIDVAALSWQPVEAGATVAPVASFNRDMAWVGARGTF